MQPRVWHHNLQHKIAYPPHIDSIQELTSRLASADVVSTMEKLSISLKGRPFKHKVTSVQKFHAKSFGLLMEHYKSVSQNQELEEALVETGVKEYLNA